jgi:hypothetical protein
MVLKDWKVNVCRSTVQYKTIKHIWSCQNGDIKSSQQISGKMEVGTRADSRQILDEIWRNINHKNVVSGTPRGRL